MTSGSAAVAAKTGGGHLPTTQEFLLGIIPDSVVGAFAENTLLAVLFFSCLFGIALAQPRSWWPNGKVSSTPTGCAS